MKFTTLTSIVCLAVSTAFGSEPEKNSVVTTLLDSNTFVIGKSGSVSYPDAAEWSISKGEAGDQVFYKTATDDVQVADGHHGSEGSAFFIGWDSKNKKEVRSVVSFEKLYSYSDLPESYANAFMNVVDLSNPKDPKVMACNFGTWTARSCVGVDLRICGNIQNTHNKTIAKIKEKVTQCKSECDDFFGPNSRETYRSMDEIVKALAPKLKSARKYLVKNAGYQKPFSKVPENVEEYTIRAKEGPAATSSPMELVLDTCTRFSKAGYATWWELNKDPLKGDNGQPGALVTEGK